MTSLTLSLSLTLTAVTCLFRSQAATERLDLLGERMTDQQPDCCYHPSDNRLGSSTDDNSEADDMCSDNDEDCLSDDDEDDDDDDSSSIEDENDCDSSSCDSSLHRLASGLPGLPYPSSFGLPHPSSLRLSACPNQLSYCKYI